jgi:hypothetical protein
MYKKLNQNIKLKTSLIFLAVFMLIGFVSLWPYDEVEAGANALGTFFGGRIVTPVPSGYPWMAGPVPMYCPPHIIIVSFGAPYRGPLALLIPPVIPKMYYNWYTPGVAVTGAYTPTPIPLCPFYPVFPTTLMGTSVK